MKKSNDTETQKFIDNVEVQNSNKYQILQLLRQRVFDNIPEVKERMMYGGIMFSFFGDFGGVFVYQNHVSFEFGDGSKFEDPKKVLEGKGKYRRHLKLRSPEEIEVKEVDFFVKQAKKFRS